VREYRKCFWYIARAELLIEGNVKSIDKERVCLNIKKVGKGEMRLIK
jgi:hypothetical protein